MPDREARARSRVQDVVGQCLGEGADKVAVCLERVAAGDAELEFYVAALYGGGREFDGGGVATDEGRHHLWLARAAEKDHVVAQYFMVLQYIEDGLADKTEGGYEAAQRWMCRLDRNLVKIPYGFSLWVQDEDAYRDSIEIFKEHIRSRAGHPAFEGCGRH